MAGYEEPVEKWQKEKGVTEEENELAAPKSESSRESTAPEETSEPERETNKPENEEPVIKNFQRVRSLTKEFTSTEFDNIPDTEEDRPKRITEVRGGYQKVRRTTAEFNFDLSGIKGLDEIDEGDEKVVRNYKGYRKRSSVPTLIAAFAVVIALAGIIFLYFTLKSAGSEVTGGTSAGKTEQTTTIDRNYDVPVTYPYNKSDENNPAANGTVEDQPGKNQEESKTADNTGAVKPDIAVIREPVNAQRIGNYIYQYPEGIVAQVSSWKSQSVALSEVQKYRDAGYTAFAEKAEIQSMGLYYRVRVGYFKSLEEAENFVNGNH